jgi:uncharacterized membrane protein SirB2
METQLFIYGICLIGIFSMLSLQAYKEWLDNKDDIISFIMYMTVDIITIVAFIVQFSN